jgi:ABC-2 type transport system permease protein
VGGPGHRGGEAVAGRRGAARVGPPDAAAAGKVLGLGALGLAQILLLAGVAAGGLLLTDVIEVPPAAWGALALVIPWYVLGFLLYATLFAMAGSVVARVEDMQSAVMPVIIVLVLALFGAQFALTDPTGTLSATSPACSR